MDLHNLLSPRFSNSRNTLFFVTLLCFSVTNSNGCKFPAIFNFGDSNSDTGGLAATFGQLPPPYGETFFHHPSGRDSDGRLIIDFMAESLGLPYLSAYLDAVGANFSHGANFATSGSTIRPQNKTLAHSGYSPISLDVQLSQYSQFLERSQFTRKRGGVFEKLLPEKDQFGQGLYTFDIGQNDITSSYEVYNMTTEEIKGIVPDLLGQFSSVIKDVYEKGGRTFWIHNTGPVGCLPYMILKAPKNASFDRYGCAMLFNDVAQYFNRGLKHTVAQLRKALPLASITYVDIYSAKYFLITRAETLGFEKPLEVCCGYGGGKYNYDPTLGCGSKRVVNGTIEMAKACEDPSKRIVWDGIHYTEAANKWIFNRILNSSSFISHVPINSRGQTLPF